MHTSTVHACAAAELGKPTWRSSPSSLAASNLNVLDGQAGRQRLLQLVGLLEVLHAQGVQVFAAAPAVNNLITLSVIPLVTTIEVEVEDRSVVVPEIVQPPVALTFR